jgi:MCP family monocarboxylic acid transporter-like MFS transporter 10
MRDGVTAQVKNMKTTNAPLQTFWLLTIMNGASTIGRITMAGFADKTGALNMHICAQLLSSILILAFWTLVGSTSAAIAFCVCFGMTSGTVIGLPPASVANVLACTYRTPETKRFAHSKLGHWTGMMYSAAAIPSLVGPVVAGHLITKYSTYLTVQCWAGASLSVSALCMIVARWHLPCADGEFVSVKLARKLGRHPDSIQEKGKRREVRNEDDTDADMVTNMSRATTRVPSTFVSRQGSGEKGDEVDPAIPSAVLRGSDKNV